MINDNDDKILADKIRELVKNKKAVMLAHNYQRPEIQDIADYVGDSLFLSRKAAETSAELILFCGVTFMAETAKILSPKKKVIIPRLDALCPMAAMISADEMKDLIKANIDAAVVVYVNTTAEVKALADVCCTSGNARKVVNSVDKKKIIFAPDRNLGNYCKKFTEKEIHIYNGYCYVHNRITPEKIIRSREKVPNAKILAHPECPAETLEIVDEVLSTEGMLEYVKRSEHKEFVIATEPGIIHRMKKETEGSGKTFYAVSGFLNCRTMKLTSLQDVYDSINEEKYEIKLEQDLIEKAYSGLKKMIDL